MPEPSMPETIANAIVKRTAEKAVDVAWNGSAQIMKWLKKFYSDWGKARVLVIGRSGSGKTTLGKVLSGTINPLADNPWEFNSSEDMEEHVAQGNSAMIRVAPGQELYNSITNQEYAELQRGGFSGVISFPHTVMPLFQP